MFDYVKTLKDEWLAVVALGEPTLGDGCRANRAAAAAREEIARRAEARAAKVLMVYPQGDSDWVTVLGSDPVTGAAVVRLPDGRKVWTSTDALVTD